MFITDPLGKIIPPGRVARTMEENFLTGTLPSWLATTGSQVFSSPPTGPGQLQLTTAATNGAVAQLTTAWTVGIVHYDAILWTCEGIRLDTANESKVVPQISIAGTNIGGLFEMPATGTKSLLRANRAGGNLDTSDVPVNWRSTLPINLTLGLGFHKDGTGELIVMSDDQVLAHRQAITSWGAGNVTPKLSITNQEAVAHTLRIGQVRLQVFADA